MFQIEKRFPCLDVFVEGEERGQGVRAGRAQSAPPPDSGKFPSQDEPATAISPGRTPVDSASDLPEPGASRHGPSQSVSETDEERHSRSGLNAGSVSHPVLCKRPCVLVATGRFCAASAACDFCHLAHDRASYLDKRHRNAIQEVSKVDFLRLTLPTLKQKAREAALGGGGTQALFSVLEHELQSEEQSSTNPVFPSRVIRHLRLSSFAAVAGWAAQKCTEAGRAQVQEAVRALRMQSSGA